MISGRPPGRPWLKGRAVRENIFLPAPDFVQPATDGRYLRLPKDLET